MLDDFLVKNRQEIIERSGMLVAGRGSPRLGAAEQTANGIPAFLDQLVEALRRARGSNGADQGSILASGAKHGEDLLRSGVSIAQVVRDYGDVCQLITELAIEQDAEISPSEFQTFNLCLDNATAEAVTAYAERSRSNDGDDGTERLGLLAHEMRNFLNTAALSLEAIRSGRVAVSGSTGDLLGRSLKGLRELIDRSLAEVRLDAGITHVETIAVSGFLEELEIGAAMQAADRGIRFSVGSIERSAAIDGDRLILTAVLTNMLDNAFKFSRRGGTVTLTTRVVGARVLFEVEDDCGGLPVTDGEQLFAPFEQRGGDRSGAGLGLALCRKGAQANGGLVHVRDLPGKGCVFTLDVPLHRIAPEA